MDKTKMKFNLEISYNLRTFASDFQKQMHNALF